MKVIKLGYRSRVKDGKDKKANNHATAKHTKNQPTNQRNKGKNKESSKQTKIKSAIMQSRNSRTLK